MWKIPPLLQNPGADFIHPADADVYLALTSVKRGFKVQAGSRGGERPCGGQLVGKLSRVCGWEINPTY